MKVLLIHNQYRFSGGEETYVQNLITLLKQHRHQVWLYTKQTKPVGFINKLGIAANLFWNSQVATDIDAIAKKFQPDFAFVQNIYPLIGPTVYQALKSHHIPIIQRISNYRPVCPNTLLFRDSRICQECVNKKIAYPSVLYGCYNSSHLSSFIFSLAHFYHQYTAKSFNLIDTFMFPSPFIHDYLIKHQAIPRHKAVIIPTFAFSSNPPKTPLPHKNYFLYAGRLSAEKGVLEFIDFFGKKLPLPHQLIVLGDGPLRKEVQTAANKRENVLYKGSLPREKVLSYIRGATALIIPSRWYDVLPNIALEAFSVGTPVVAPDIGTFSTLIEMGKNGFKYVNEAELKYILLRLAKRSCRIKRENIRVNSKQYLNPHAHYQLLMKTAHAIIKTQ